MPYVITTKGPARAGDWHAAMSEAAGIDASVESRRAVATLAEANRAVADGQRRAVGFVTGVSLPESGGTIGPLPDGTVIEVESLSPLMLSARISGDKAGLGVLIRGCLDRDDWTDLIDAFNARHGHAAPSA